jgi:hypothetical protein
MHAFMHSLCLEEMLLLLSLTDEVIECAGRSKVRFRSKPECLPKARMSAFASCGHQEETGGSPPDLKRLMADVTRAMEKAQEAVAKIASKTAAVTTETESPHPARRPAALCLG